MKYAFKTFWQQEGPSLEDIPYGMWAEFHPERDLFWKIFTTGTKVLPPFGFRK